MVLKRSASGILCFTTKVEVFETLNYRPIRLNRNNDANATYSVSTRNRVRPNVCLFLWPRVFHNSIVLGVFFLFQRPVRFYDALRSKLVHYIRVAILWWFILMTYVFWGSNPGSQSWWFKVKPYGLNYLLNKLYTIYYIIFKNDVLVCWL